MTCARVAKGIGKPSDVGEFEFFWFDTSDGQMNHNQSPGSTIIGCSRLVDSLHGSGCPIFVPGFDHDSNVKQVRCRGPHFQVDTLPSAIMEPGGFHVD